MENSSMHFTCITGADEALAWVLSWYEDLDIKSVKGQREGSKWETDPSFVKKRQAAAFAMAKWARTKTYIPGPNLSDDEIDPEDAVYEVNDDSFAEFEDDDDEATESEAETRHTAAAARSNEASTSQVRVETSSDDALKQAAEIGAKAVSDLVAQNPDAAA